ncbi:MAG: alpha/beta hydrolase [Alphaproteobacteria bacterium]|nr:alpha/beta hydrolase [Alphaproteobacteria bacterium]
MKKLFLFTLPFVAIFAALWLLRTPDTDPAAMAKKYTNPASKFAEDAEGLRVHYRDEGAPDGVPIIFLHGTSASLHTFAPLVDALGETYRVITYTQPGHGLTGPHPRDDYSFAGMAEGLNLVTEELGLDHFVLGGNSMGGWVAWRYALANPDRVDALILIDAAGMPLRDGEEEPPLNIGFRLLANPVGRYIVQNYTPRELVKESALESVSVKLVMDAAAVDRYWELLRLPGNRRAAVLGWVADIELPFADRLGEITTPTLIIWGAEDQLIFPSAAQTFDERLPNADVIVYDGVGHIPMEEAPDRTARDIDGFLQTVFEPQLELPQ